MAREIFPKVQPGDRLSAERVNELSGIARDQSTKWQGSFVQGRENATSNLPPHAQRIVIITEVTDQTQLLFECRLRFYNSTATAWETDDTQGPFVLDEGSFGNEGADRETGSLLQVGDLVTAWWDDQREAWIPVLTGTTTTSTTCPVGTCTYHAELVHATTTTDVGAEGSPTTPEPIPGWVLVSCNCSDPSTSTSSTTSTTPEVPVNDCQNCTEPPEPPTAADVAASTLFNTCCVEPTTTTPPPCSGFCRYVWNTATNEWDLGNDQCSENCQCDNAPQFCGDENCDNVKVGCVPDNQAVPPPPDCASTTTPIPTTCPPDDGSTTSSPGCTTCTWAWVSDHWILTSNGCLNDFCICPAPSSPGTLCETVTNFCEQIPPPPDPQPFCAGACDWQWDIAGTGWFNIRFECFSNIDTNPCVCPEPSFDGTVCGQFARTGCRFTNPTTTADPGTTTTLCGQPPPPTTTTTFLPCAGFCRWQWDATLGMWETVDKPGCEVADGCVCFAPVDNGDFDCEIRSGPCGTTTSTTAPPTTTSSTTTTCGHPGFCSETESNSCSWLCVSAGSGGGPSHWSKQDSGCCAFIDPPSSCVPPCPPEGCTIGDTTQTKCITAFRCRWSWNGSTWDLLDDQCECDKQCDTPPDPGAGVPIGSINCNDCTPTTTTSTTSTTTTPHPYWCQTNDIFFNCQTGCVTFPHVNIGCVTDGPFDTLQDCLDSSCIPTTTTTAPGPCTCDDAGLIQCGVCVYQCQLATSTWEVIYETCGSGSTSADCSNLSLDSSCVPPCTEEKWGDQFLRDCCSDPGDCS